MEHKIQLFLLATSGKNAEEKNYIMLFWTSRNCCGKSLFSFQNFLSHSISIKKIVFLYAHITHLKCFLIQNSYFLSLFMMKHFLSFCFCFNKFVCFFGCTPTHTCTLEVTFLQRGLIDWLRSTRHAFKRRHEKASSMFLLFSPTQAQKCAPNCKCEVFLWPLQTIKATTGFS